MRRTLKKSPNCNQDEIIEKNTKKEKNKQSDMNLTWGRNIF